MTNDAYKVAELHRRQLFLERTNNAFAALKSNRKAWKEEQEKRAVWDTALLDGLKDELINQCKKTLFDVQNGFE